MTPQQILRELYEVTKSAALPAVGHDKCLQMAKKLSEALPKEDIEVFDFEKPADVKKAKAKILKVDAAKKPVKKKAQKKK